MFLNKQLFILITLLALFGCTESKNNTQDEKLTGMNINWSFLPPLTQDIVDATASLNPKMIRYPGGSVSKTWNWEDGTTSKSINRPPHTLDDLLIIKEATNAKVTFVLNTINKTLENQLELLRTARAMGIPIEYIEMGNEHYLGKGNNADDAGNHQDNVDAFPTGKEYAEFVNNWSPAIRDEFPDAKIGISMLARTNKNTRLQTWNDLIVSTIEAKNFDAYIYHIYVRSNSSLELNDENISEIIKERTDIFESVKIDDNSKKVWITEYGVHADTLDKTVTLTSALADYIEAEADIALPQVLYTKSSSTFFSMLTAPDADALTALGEMFAERWK